MLFAMDAAGAASTSAERVIGDFWRELPGDADGRAYADMIVRGVSEARVDIDRQLDSASRNWRVERMSTVDRNVLRIGAWELSHGEAPPAVVLDEAVELAKRFGSSESASFVNGVLDRVAKDSQSA